MGSLRQLIREMLKSYADENTYMKVIGKKFGEAFPVDSYTKSIADRTITYAKFFDGQGEDFKANNMAENYLRSEGYTVGSMARDLPIGFAPNNYRYVAKWTNLSSEDIDLLDGVIYFPDKDSRNGNAVVLFFIFPE